LWIDVANALDVIAGRRELGMLDPAQAALLTAFVMHGYVVLPNAVDPVVLDRAEAAADTAFSGGFAPLLFACPQVSPQHSAWHPDMARHPAKALDLHWFSAPVRQAIFSDAIVSFLHLLFERPALASQSLTFHLGSGQELHQDTAYVPYTLPLQFAASWIALEDVKAGAGELEYLVDSHRRLPEFLYDGAHKSVSEAQRAGLGGNELNDQVQQHVQDLQRAAATGEMKRERFLARRGDALIWHADLAHGGSPVSPMRTRKSIVTHYCPREVAPLFFEYGPVPFVAHDRSFFTSHLYHEPVGDIEAPAAAAPASKWSDRLFSGLRRAR
jgi:hypothetical protein